MRTRLTCLAALAAVIAAEPALAHDRDRRPHRRAPTLRLVPVGTYDTGLAANGAEILSIRKHDARAVLTNIRAAECGADTGAVDVLDLSDPAHPALVRRVCITPAQTAAGAPNSAAIHPHRDYFLVAVGASGAQGAIAAYRVSDGAFLAAAPVGIQPDSVGISPDGRWAVVANEAEAVDRGLNGGAGSLSLVDLRKFERSRFASLPVTQIPLPSLAGYPGLSTGRTDDVGRIAIDNSPETLEPESVAFSADSKLAYVTLQENDAVVRYELATGTLDVFGLGSTTHAADLTVDGAYAPLETLTALRESDGIAVDPSGRFFVTADEGDTRNASGSSGPRGGRTVSLFDATSGELIADTGSQLDDWADLAGYYPDDRSGRGGSEPEVLDLVRWRGRTLVAVGLERANAVALVDVTDPSEPAVIDIEATGTGPEGVKFMTRRDDLYVVTANEVSGTVSILGVVPSDSVNAARFAIISDPHLYDVETLGAGTPEFQRYLASDRKMLVESEEILDAAIARIVESAPDFVLVAGDLTKDGERVNHRLLAQKLAALERTGTQVFVIPGNHDVNNPHALDYSQSPPIAAAQVTPREFTGIYREHGYREAIARDPASLSYVAEPVPGLWLFAMDSAKYEDNAALGYPVTGGALRPATKAWVQRWLEEAGRRGKVAIGMAHHGVVEHFAGQAALFSEYLVDDRQALAADLAAAGLHLVFTGHFHANDAVTSGAGLAAMTDVETGSLVTSPSPIRLVQVDLPARRFAVSTRRVTSIPSHPDDFPVWSAGYLAEGLTGITFAQLTSPPFSLDAATAAQVTPLVVGGLVAHYAGDEQAPPQVTAAIQAMLASGDPATVALGQSLYGLWTDPGLADGKLVVTLPE